MSYQACKLRGRMCSRLWTAHVLTLAQVLTLLFVGSCFCRVTEAPSHVTRAKQSNVTVTSLFKKPSTQGVSNQIKGQSITSVTKGYMSTLKTTVGISTPSTKKVESTTTQVTRKPEVRMTVLPTVAPRAPARLQERLAAIDCDLPLLPNESRLWRGNETHELNLPITMPEDCITNGGSSTAGSMDDECPPVILSWEGSADIQSGDILIVRIADSALLETSTTDLPRRTTERSNATENDGERMHRSPPQPAVYQVTRQGHEHCDVTDGMLLDIAPLAEQHDKLITLYDKDLTEGVNLLIVVSESWGSQCVRLKVTVKSDNCGDSQDCSGKGVCYSNISMEGYECQCCPGWVGPHCEERDACAPSPCRNNGICVDLTQPNDNTYQCLCPYGFTGQQCEMEIDPCSSLPCLNGGSCAGNQNGSAFRCTCPEGWGGNRCERPAAAGACTSQPCVNGICIEIPENEAQKGSDAYKCFCQPGFAGERCEYEFNECESSPCANGGTCTDRVGGFVCACGRGYTGRTCHLKVDLCSPNPCPSHRFCIDRGNSYACECPRGFVGDDCSEPARAACDNNPCAHGGTCWNGVDSFYCACRPGYTGRLCEEDFILESVVADGEVGGAERLSEGGGGGGAVREVRLPLGLYHDRLHNVYIAAGTLGAAIAIVGVVVTACHCRVNKTYARFLSRVSRATEAGPPHHWLQDKRAPTHSTHTSAHPAPYPPAALDTTDMYYTLDFSDSQSSPLIQ